MRTLRFTNIALCAAALIGSIAACTPKEENVAVTGVEISETSLTLTVGDKQTLTANVKPENATDKSVAWNTNTPAVATVSSTGEVTAVSVGQAIVTVTTQSGRKTARCTVIVQAGQVPVAGVSLNKSATVIPLGEFETLTATVTPEDATEKRVTWRSGNEKVATVDTEGKVTAVAVGVATITVTTVDGGKSDECEVTVTPPDMKKLLLQGFAGDNVTVTYTDESTETAVRDGEGSFLYPESRSKTIKSITLGDGTPILIGRNANEDLGFKVEGNAFVMRDAVDGVIPVGSFAEFQLINASDETKAGSYRQEADLDLMSEEWVPVSTFSGTFDGAGFSLANFNIKNESANECALFGQNTGTLKNIRIASGSVKAFDVVAGICGLNKGTVDGCSNNAVITARAQVGGIVGNNEGGSILNSYNTAAVNASLVDAGQNAGGVCGLNDHSGSVIACFNTGDVQGHHHIGGVVGNNGGSAGGVKIVACYNTASVIGPGLSYSFGGIAGINIANSSIEACYNTGYVGVTSTWDVGGVCGRNTSGTVKGCYYLKDSVTGNAGPWGIGGVADQNDASATDENAEPMQPGKWPSATVSPAWGIGTGGENGYWKTLGKYDETNSEYPKLWFEE